MIDDLSMAHDNLQRELADIKRLIGKDKHELIKSNIALNKRVQELKKENHYLRERENEIININQHRVKYLAEIESRNIVLEQQNKRYLEALEFYADEETYESSEVQIGAVTKEGYKISKYKFVPIINTDKGEKARKALDGDSDE